MTATTVPASDEQFRVDTIEETTVVIENCRIEFDIEHNLKKHPNSCVIKITNLNEATRSLFKSSPLKIALEAGYADSAALLFSGDVTFALSSLDGPNWVTTIEGGDGYRVIANATVNKSYKEGTTKGSIMKEAFDRIGSALPDNIKNSAIYNEVIQGGIALSGNVIPEMDKLLKPNGYSMSIQDGKPMILQEDETVGDTYTLGEAEGMIGSPEFGKPSKKGRPPDVRLRCLLHPKIRPGHDVEINSHELKGTFKVKSVKHRGDTHGGDWVTEVEIAPPGA